MSGCGTKPAGNPLPLFLSEKSSPMKSILETVKPSFLPEILVDRMFPGLSAPLISPIAEDNRRTQQFFPKTTIPEAVVASSTPEFSTAYERLLVVPYSFPGSSAGLTGASPLISVALASYGSRGGSRTGFEVSLFFLYALALANASLTRSISPLGLDSGEFSRERGGSESEDEILEVLKVEKFFFGCAENETVVFFLLMGTREENAGCVNEAIEIETNGDWGGLRRDNIIIDYFKRE
ncbi:NSP-interacting kinase 2 [Striga asiatica]|uniref:NSP-interacting kinase 2 n=1 Tax=Striga asiatica TaxID=4170 RepID=A0A5A7PZR7_STRAF|nr:NSP-interacting kinase 2 [Striga asiatica]